MPYCCCSLAGTGACVTCQNNPYNAPTNQTPPLPQMYHQQASNNDKKIIALLTEIRKLLIDLKLNIKEE
jgi:hypothetical protein